MVELRRNGVKLREIAGESSRLGDKLGLNGISKIAKAAVERQQAA